MQLDVARSERRPGVELVLRTDNALDPSFRDHVKNALNPWYGDVHDSQVFFMGGDGLLRSKSSGHPIGCETDEENGMINLVVQPPRPFNISQPPHYQFEYDQESETITVRSIARDVCASPQSQTGPYSPLSLDTLNSNDSGVCFSVTSMDSSLADTEQHHLLEFIPRQHRHTSFSQAFDRFLESPTDVSPPDPSRRQDKVRNNSWNENRLIQLVPGRKHYATQYQRWQIIPANHLMCEVRPKAWPVLS